MFNKKIDTKKLYNEYINSKKDKRKEVILNSLIENKAENEIIDIIKSGKYNKEEKYYILIFLIESNFNYSKLKPVLDLLLIRDDGIEEYFQNKIIRKLYNAKKEEDLFYILKNYTYFSEKNRDSIFNFIIKSNSTPEQMRIIFDKFSNIYKEKIINNLIETNEIIEIENNYLNLGFNKLIIKFLLKNKKNNFEQIQSFYNKVAESKFKDDAGLDGIIIEELVNIALKNDDIMSEQFLFLFDRCNEDSRIKIINRTIEFDSHDVLLDILTSINCSKENKSIIVSYLIENTTDFKILKILFSKTPYNFKENIIDKLIAMNAIKELESNYLNLGHDKKIFNHLLTQKQKDKSALRDLYAKNIDLNSKDNIVNLLLDLKAVKELSDILFNDKCSETNIILITTYLLEESLDYVILKKIFDSGNNSVKKRIIDRLLSINASEELIKNYFDNGYNEKIIKSLLNSDDLGVKKLKMFYDKCKDQSNRTIIILKLIKIKASRELLEILNNKNSSVKDKNDIVIYFINESTDFTVLRIIFNSSNKSFQDMIIEKLLNTNQIEELIKNYLNKGFNIEIIDSYFRLSKKINISSLVTLFYNLNDDKSKNKIVDILIKLGAVNELKKIFNKSDSKKILFPKLLGLSIFSDDEIIIYIMETIEAKVSKNDNFLTIILSYLELLSENKYPLIIHNLINKKFLHFFNKGLINGKEFYLVLCSFINIKKFKKEVLFIKENFVIVDDIQKNKLTIKEKYSKLLESATQKKEIEKIVKKREEELSKLFTKEKFDFFITISEMYFSLKPNKNNIIYTGINIPIEKLLSDIQIVKNSEIENKRITKFLTNELNNLKDTDKIMQLKAEVEKERETIISQNDFCFTLQNLPDKEIENIKLIHRLGEILVATNDIEIQKSILEFSSKSDIKLWLIYILRISSNKELINSIYNAIKNKFFLGNFRFIIERKELWNQVRFKMMFFDHIFYYIFNLTKKEIPELLKVTETELNSLPKNMQKITKNIFTNIINKVNNSL